MTLPNNVPFTTRLHCAVISEDIQLVKELLNNPEVDPNVLDYFGLAPIHYIGFQGLNDILVEFGKCPRVIIDVRTGTPDTTKFEEINIDAELQGKYITILKKINKILKPN